MGGNLVALETLQVPVIPATNSLDLREIEDVARVCSKHEDIMARCLLCPEGFISVNSHPNFLMVFCRCR